MNLRKKLKKLKRIWIKQGGTKTRNKLNSGRLENKFKFSLVISRKMLNLWMDIIASSYSWIVYRLSIQPSKKETRWSVNRNSRGKESKANGKIRKPLNGKEMKAKLREV